MGNTTGIHRQGYRTRLLRQRSAPVFFCLFFLVMHSGFAFKAGARELVDQTGRTIAVPEDPRRVVALAPSITEIVFALDQEGRLVGATRFSDYPAAARKLTKVGSYVRLDLERITALAPDLCIAVKDGNPIEIVRRLEDLGIPVFAVDPRDLDSVMTAIDQIGRLLNAGDRADALVRDMEDRIDRIHRRAQAASRRPGVFFQIGIQPIVAVGTDTFIHKLIETAGGRNLTAGEVPYPRLSREQVLALAPEVILITSMAREETFVRMKAEWARWTDLPAVRQGRIHLVDSDLFDRPGPRMVMGLELLFELIHPDLARKAPN
ncbi:MAG: ABC transporter substrate-binding protein [Desulfococcaceae bacterium]